VFLKYLLDRNLVHMLLELPTFRGLGQPCIFIGASGFWPPFAIRMQCTSGFRKCISASPGHLHHSTTALATATVCCTSIWYLTEALTTNALTGHSTNLVTRFCDSDAIYCTARPTGRPLVKLIWFLLAFYAICPSVRGASEFARGIKLNTFRSVGQQKVFGVRETYPHTHTLWGQVNQVDQPFLIVCPQPVFLAFLSPVATPPCTHRNPRPPSNTLREAQPNGVFSGERVTNYLIIANPNYNFIEVLEKI